MYVNRYKMFCGVSIAGDAISVGIYVKDHVNDLDFRDDFYTPRIKNLLRDLEHTADQVVVELLFNPQRTMGGFTLKVQRNLNRLGGEDFRFKCISLDDPSSVLIHVWRADIKSGTAFTPLGTVTVNKKSHPSPEEIAVDIIFKEGFLR
jgi:hypothetical protein